MSTPSNRRPGLGSVGSYQVSGTPFLSGCSGLPNGAEMKISFPAVTKNIKIFCTDATRSVRVHFDSKDDANTISGLHFYTITSGSIEMNVKCKEIWVSNPPTGNGGSGSPSGYRVVAELTGISPNEMFTLTGSGLTTIDGS